MALDKKSKPSPAAPDSEAPEKQDRSIKDRKSSIFERHDHVVNSSTRPFEEYIKTVPAEPLSPLVKGALIALGVVVVLLLLAAIMTAGNRRARKRQADHALPRPTVVAFSAERFFRDFSPNTTAF